MLQLRQTNRHEDVWGAFDDRGHQLLSIECTPGGCHVRLADGPPGRGRLLASFMGPRAADEARGWAERYSQSAAAPRVMSRPKPPGAAVSRRADHAHRTRESFYHPI